MRIKIHGKTYTARMTTAHPASSYRIPVLVLGPRSEDVILQEDPFGVFVIEEGTALGTRDARDLGVQLIRADPDEELALTRGGYRLPRATPPW